VRRRHGRVWNIVGTTVTVTLACVAIAACGGTSRRNPTSRDTAVVARSLSDIVYQCQSVAAGFIAAADHVALKRDVDALLVLYSHVERSAPLVFRSPSGSTRRTTLLAELALARGNLEDAQCSPTQARRIAIATAKR
jgi:hypothetical protein